MQQLDPQLEDRTYQEILDEALARIPVHNPEWTNFNDSDPGVTLLQLFAFMSESLSYRANLLPDRNRQKFLRLLGIERLAAASAEGLVVFSNPNGQLETQTLEEDQVLLAGSIPFRTLDGLDVLPIEAKAFYKARSVIAGPERAQTEALFRLLNPELAQPDVELAFYETKAFEPSPGGDLSKSVDLGSNGDTVDGALWIALMRRKKDDDLDQVINSISKKTLTLAVVPALQDARRVLLEGGKIQDVNPGVELRYEMMHVQGGLRRIRFRSLVAKPSSDVLSVPGVVEITLPGENVLKAGRDDTLDPMEAGVGALPPRVEDSEVEQRIIAWIRVRLPEARIDGGLRPRLGYVGINAARIQERVRIASEFLGLGTGEPYQTRTFVNTPVILDSIRLTVNGIEWKLIDDLAAAPPEVPRLSGDNFDWGSLSSPVSQAAQVFTVDRSKGTITFGNGLHGARPPAQAVIQASYDYGGGLQGMVGPGSVSQGPALPAGVIVTNPLPTWGGAETETIEEAERRIPRRLHHRNRLVAATDFVDIARETPGVDIARVEVLPLMHPDVPDIPAPGVVTLMLIPGTDPLQPEAPRPGRLFLNTVSAHINPRRLLTTEVHVRGPNYIPIVISIGLDVVPGVDFAPVREHVKQAVERFLSPFKGGFDEDGWALGHDVDARELLAIAARVKGVARINQVLLGSSKASGKVTVPMKGLDLPHVLAVSVSAGAPQNLDELLGKAPAGFESNTDDPADAGASDLGLGGFPGGGGFGGPGGISAGLGAGNRRNTGTADIAGAGAGSGSDAGSGANAGSGGTGAGDGSGTGAGTGSGADAGSGGTGAGGGSGTGAGTSSGGTGAGGGSGAGDFGDDDGGLDNGFGDLPDGPRIVPVPTVPPNC